MRVVLPAMTVKQIVVDDEPTEGDYVDNFGAYRIEIDTPDGRWVIEGCHDAGPEVYGPDGQPYISPDEACRGG